MILNQPLKFSSFSLLDQFNNQAILLLLKLRHLSHMLLIAQYFRGFEKSMNI